MLKCAFLIRHQNYWILHVTKYSQSSGCFQRKTCGDQFLDWTLSTWHCCQPGSESQTFTLRLSAPVVLTSIQSNREADKLNIRAHKCARVLSTSCALNLCTHRISSRSAAPSLTRKHTGIQAFYSASVGWCGRHYAALPHQAQTGSQINILSPAGQPVQAGLSASESLSLGFRKKRKKPTAPL